MSSLYIMENLPLGLYLIPVTLGDTPVSQVLPAYNKEVILGIRHFIVRRCARHAAF